METNPESLAGILDDGPSLIKEPQKTLPYSLRLIVPDDLLDHAFAGTVTNPNVQREEVKTGLIKCAAGMPVNRNMVRKLCKLGLVFNTNTLTEKGQEYLMSAISVDKATNQTLRTGLLRVHAGNEYPYDAPDNWWKNVAPKEIPPRNWAHAAARGVMAELRGDSLNSRGLLEADEETRDALIHMLELIIRAAHENAGEFENRETKENDDEN